jgi:hypothetical protein
MPLKRYRAEDDDSLTKHQAVNKGFRPEAGTLGGNFRFASNPTSLGHKSGYHESFVTTDTFNYLRDTKKNGTYNLSNTTTQGSFFGQHKGAEVHGEIHDEILTLADGFRTDTARTVLSSTEGRIAGHSGSGIDTTGQSDAHNLLREVIIKLIKRTQKPAGLTRKSLATLAGSVTVTSMAPRQLIEKNNGHNGLSQLKSGSVAVNSWEENRNEAKRRVHKSFDKLNQAEKNFVVEHASSYLKATQKGVSEPTIRRINTGRCNSPERTLKYVSTDKIKSPLKDLPDDSLQYGLYMTEPFRDSRR